MEWLEVTLQGGRLGCLGRGCCVGVDAHQRGPERIDRRCRRPIRHGRVCDLAIRGFPGARGFAR